MERGEGLGAEHGLKPCFGDIKSASDAILYVQRDQVLHKLDQICAIVNLCDEG